MKSDFVSTVSHEFKSPLTSIRQLAEMLQAGRVPSQERRQEYYGVLVEQSSRLSALVANILDLARMEEGKKEFRFELSDVEALLEEVVSVTRHRVSHTGFVIQSEVDQPLPKVLADGEAISQAISNLLDNAVKYSGEAKTVTVKGFVSDKWVTIAVEDFGVGIPGEEIDRVFDRFFRGGNELTRSVKGSGLGLTLVKQVVEAHGGEVQVESAMDQGSTFSIRLPIPKEESRA
jgi:signal transduction histidine kinase